MYHARTFTLLNMCLFHNVDRKAFFAVVSLLIDPEEVPESEKLTEDNYEAFLPPQHKKLVDALKA